MVADHRSPPMSADGPAKRGFEPAYMNGLIMGGLVVAAKAQTANRKRVHWMKGCEPEDPADQLREVMGDALGKTFSLEVRESERTTRAKTLEDVIKVYPGVDLILDISTSNWGIRSVKAPNAKGQLVHFAVAYEGSLRLIDPRQRAVIAEATCLTQFTNGDAPPTVNELLEDDCALLNEGLKANAEACASWYRKTALGLP
jgi:hypothetical protein